MKFNSLILAAGLLALNANATIIENDSIVANSFKDTGTNLVWMDFGVNNNRSYSDVVSQLGIGGDYYGWRLPTLAEVYTMWTNLANLANVDANLEIPNNSGPGQLYAISINSNVAGGDDSVWDDAFNVIGYNTSSSNTLRTLNEGVAWFAGTDGLSFVSFVDGIDELDGEGTALDILRLVDNANFNDYLDRFSPDSSTLLVATDELTTDKVAAPSSIALFALALLGMGVKRRRKA